MLSVLKTIATDLLLSATFLLGSGVRWWKHCVQPEPFRIGATDGVTDGAADARTSLLFPHIDRIVFLYDDGRTMPVHDEVALRQGLAEYVACAHPPRRPEDLYAAVRDAFVEHKRRHTTTLQRLTSLLLGGGGGGGGGAFPFPSCITVHQDAALLELTATPYPHACLAVAHAGGAAIKLQQRPPGEEATA